MNEFIQSIQTLLLYNAQYKLKVGLYLAVKQSIRTLQWRRDLKCSSSCFLSESLGISRDTVEKTYQQLEQEGWLYRIKGKGTFIKVNAQRKIELNTSTTLPAVSSNEFVLPESQQLLQVLFSIKTYIFLQIVCLKYAIFHFENGMKQKKKFWHKMG